MVRAQLQRAFRIWSEASALTFVEVEQGAKAADILVSFLKGPHGDGYPFDGEGSVLAHAFFPGEGIGGDAHFDAEERWLPSEPEDDDGVNLFAVAAHEIGHSLGLSHSSTPGSLMFPYYQILGEHFRLPQDDADGIQHLYGLKDPPSDPATTTPATPPEATTKATRVVVEPTEGVRHLTTTTQKSLLPLPDICNSTIDAISVIRREVFVFKGNYFWRLHSNRTLRPGYPVSIDRFWYDLPPNISKIDALYERPSDTKIVFFAGKNFWLFSANQLESGYPKPLTDLGLPEDVDRVDAAMVWGHNGKTYLFSGMQYWKFDEEENKVELDYPRSITAWRGVPSDIDAAFQWTDGITYFFKNDKFWKFVDVKMRTESEVPSEIGGFWFRCPSQNIGDTISTMTAIYDPTVLQTHVENNAISQKTYFGLFVLILFLCYCR